MVDSDICSSREADGKISESCVQMQRVRYRQFLAPRLIFHSVASQLGYQSLEISCPI